MSDKTPLLSWGAPVALAFGVLTASVGGADWAKALQAYNMRIVGHTDLNGKGDGGEGLDLRQYPDGRRVLFFAHVNPPNCLSIVDVTQPAAPKVLHQMPAYAKHVRCNSLAVSGNVLIIAQNTDEPGQPLDGARMHSAYISPERPDRLYAGWIDGGLVILDIADKTKPKLIGQRSWYPATDGYIAHTAMPILSRNLVIATQEAGGSGCEGRKE